MKKEKFAEKIREFEGFASKFNKKIDYFVIGKNEYEGNPGSKNRKYFKVCAWNNKEERTIPVITQTHCEELIDEYGKRNLYN